MKSQRTLLYKIKDEACLRNPSRLPYYTWAELWENQYLKILAISDMNWVVQPQKLTRGMKIQKKEVEGCCIYVARTMALFTEHLICAFVFTYATRRFSIYAAHFIVILEAYLLIRVEQ